MTEHKPLTEKERKIITGNGNFRPEKEAIANELKVLLDKFGCALSDKDYTEDVAMGFQSKSEKLINKWLGGKEK